MEDLVAHASDYATSAHARIHQLRKYTRQAYDVHLRAVASRVATVCKDPAVIAAAWLHDIVEDTPATFEEIDREFGPDVAALVKDLTDVSKPSDGNRAARKALDRQHLAAASVRAKTVKLADIIDNCEDICSHDPKFGRVYLMEARELLDVLREGDPHLLETAENTLQMCAAKLDASALTGGGAIPTEAGPLIAAAHGEQSMRLFTEAFSARDILEPLSSFDYESLVRRPACVTEVAGAPVIGVRACGRVTGYLLPEDVEAGTVGAVRPIDALQKLPVDAPLTDVISALSRYTCCFATLNGVIVGVITRTELEKPVVRMWLFGIIILFEMFVVGDIRSRWQDETWVRLVSDGRLEKARQLQDERRRRGLASELLDCLQFSDKFQLLINDPLFVSQAGFPSAGAAKKAMKELESLRNNLAHGQDITTYDWAPITRLAQRIQILCHGSADHG